MSGADQFSYLTSGGMRQSVISCVSPRALCWPDWHVLVTTHNAAHGAVILKQWAACSPLQGDAIMINNDNYQGSSNPWYRFWIKTVIQGQRALPMLEAWVPPFCVLNNLMCSRTGSCSVYSVSVDISPVWVIISSTPSCGHHRAVSSWSQSYKCRLVSGDMSALLMGGG